MRRGFMPALLALFGAALVTGPFADAAGNAGTTFVATFDPTGAAFTCPGINPSLAISRLDSARIAHTEAPFLDPA